jgi:hypothetical protein
MAGPYRHPIPRRRPDWWPDAAAVRVLDALPKEVVARQLAAPE